MRDVSNDNFGPIIAYLVPGVVVLLGFSQFSSTLRTWFAAAPSVQPTIGGFLYVTIASIAVGMTVSAVRWAIVDTLHSCTGLTLPRLDFSRLGQNVTAYQLLIDIHYQHYQYYANMFVATAVAFVCYRVKLVIVLQIGWPDVAFVLLEFVFLMTSRDTLKKYYSRSEQLLSTVEDCVPANQEGGHAQPVFTPATFATEVPVQVGQQSRADSHRASRTRSATE